MTPRQIKAAAERQWRTGGIVAIDRPAGWTTPRKAKQAGSGYWQGKQRDLWRTVTKKVPQARKKP